jgi:hypothetical protein
MSSQLERSMNEHALHGIPSVFHCPFKCGYSNPKKRKVDHHINVVHHRSSIANSSQEQYHYNNHHHPIQEEETTETGNNNTYDVFIAAVACMEDVLCGV